MANYPHVEWIDLYSDGTLHECAVLKRDNIGNVFFIRLRELDVVDKRRLAKILTGRNATNFPLWDLLFQTTLGNGMNALDYFHQYVKTRTPQGRIMVPQVGVMGAALAGVIQAPTPAAAPADAAPARRSASRATPPPA